MFNLYIVLFFFSVALIFAGINFVINARNKQSWSDSNGCYAAGIVFIIISALITLLVIIFNFKMSGKQSEDFENLRMLSKQQAVHQEKLEKLTPTFKALLSKQYPEMEQKAFDAMATKSAGANMVATAYPKLRSSETLSALVAEIKSLNDSYYDVSLSKQKIIKDIRYRLVSPWIFHSWLPDIPPELQKEIFPTEKTTDPNSNRNLSGGITES